MTDTTHLTSLHRLLSAEKERLGAAKRSDEIALRSVWVAQLEREIAGEMAFLGMRADAAAEEQMTEADLLAELGF